MVKGLGGKFLATKSFVEYWFVFVHSKGGCQVDSVGYSDPYSLQWSFIIRSRWIKVASLIYFKAIAGGVIAV